MQVGPLVALIKGLKYFAGEQIRNVASLAGNIATASPISDLNPIFVATDSTLTLLSVRGSRQISIRDFFLGYRKTALGEDEIIASVTVPLGDTNVYVDTYKVSRRKDDDIALVNAAFYVSLTPEHKVKSACFVYGGVAVTTKVAQSTSTAITGLQWTPEILDIVNKQLESDLVIDASAPGGMVEYRRSLITSLFFKFFVSVQQAIAPELNDAADLSAIATHNRDAQVGHQSFESSLINRGDGVDQVGKPVHHLSGLEQVIRLIVCEASVNIFRQLVRQCTSMTCREQPLN